MHYAHQERSAFPRNRLNRAQDVEIKESIEIMKFWPPNFRRLVLFCMDSYDSESRRIFSHFSRSTRFTILCTAQISKFQQKIVKLFLSISVSVSFSFLFWSLNLVIFPRKIDGILSEFHGYSQKMMNCLEILLNTARKIWKKSGKFRNWCEVSSVPFIVSTVFQSSP